MGLNVINYALCKKNEISALSGVKSYSFDAVTGDLVMELNDGTILRRPFKDIKDCNIDTNGHLIITYSDNTTKDVGEIKGSGTCIFIGDTAPDPTKYKLWIDTSVTGGGGFGGSAVLTNDIIASTVIGSVYAGKQYPAGTSLEEPIRDILTSYVKPQMTLGISPTTTLYDVETDTLSSIEIISNVIKKTEDVEYVKFYVDDILVNTVTTGVTNGGQFRFTHNFSPVTNKTFTVKIECRDVTTHTVVTAKTTITFIGKSYYGFVPESIVVPSDTDIISLGTKLKNTKSYTYSNIPLPQDGNLYKVLYSYPKSLGALTKIEDADGRDYTNSYTRSELSINGIDYYCYLLTDGTGASGATQKFS